MNIQEHLETARRSGELEFFIEERSEDCVVSRMPVIPGALNPFGTVQAGAMLWVADVTATYWPSVPPSSEKKARGFHWR